MEEERKKEKKRGKYEEKCVNEKRKMQGKKNKRKEERNKNGEKGVRGKRVSFRNKDRKLIFQGGGGRGNKE